MWGQILALPPAYCVTLGEFQESLLGPVKWDKPHLCIRLRWGSSGLQVASTRSWVWLGSPTGWLLWPGARANVRPWHRPLLCGLPATLALGACNGPTLLRAYLAGVLLPPGFLSSRSSQFTRPAPSTPASRGSKRSGTVHLIVVKRFLGVAGEDLPGRGGLGKPVH